MHNSNHNNNSNSNNRNDNISSIRSNRSNIRIYIYIYIYIYKAGHCRPNAASRRNAGNDFAVYDDDITVVATILQFIAGDDFTAYDDFTILQFMRIAGVEEDRRQQFTIKNDAFAVNNKTTNLRGFEQKSYF